MRKHGTITACAGVGRLPPPPNRRERARAAKPSERRPPFWKARSHRQEPQGPQAPRGPAEHQETWGLPAYPAYPGCQACRGCREPRGLEWSRFSGHLFKHLQAAFGDAKDKCPVVAPLHLPGVCKGRAAVRERAGKAFKAARPSRPRSPLSLRASLGTNPSQAAWSCLIATSMPSSPSMD